MQFCRNICRNLHAFAWRKITPRGEKVTNMRDGGILAIQNCTGLAQDCMGCMVIGYLNACCVSSGLHEMTKAKKKSSCEAT